MALMLPELDAKPVTNMELLYLGAGIGHRDDAVVENAVYIGEQKLNLAAAIGER